MIIASKKKYEIVIIFFAVFTVHTIKSHNEFTTLPKNFFISLPHKAWSFGDFVGVGYFQPPFIPSIYFRFLAFREP
jgi:hypothetical protein